MFGDRLRCVILHESSPGLGATRIETKTKHYLYDTVAVLQEVVFLPAVIALIIGASSSAPGAFALAIAVVGGQRQDLVIVFVGLLGLWRVSFTESVVLLGDEGNEGVQFHRLDSCSRLGCKHFVGAYHAG
jgi:hypothetical protein